MGISVFALVLSLALAVPLIQEMPNVEIVSQTLQPVYENVYSGDQYSHTFNNSDAFEFSTQVFERNESIRTDFEDDFEADRGRLKQAYSISTHCRVEGTHITFEKVSQSAVFPKGVSAYTLDSTQSVYILSDNTVTLLRIANHGDSLTLQQNAHLSLDSLLEFDTQQAAFLNLHGRTYLGDGNLILLLKYQHGRLTKLESTDFWGAMPPDAQFVKLVALGKNSFLSLNTKTATKYTFRNYLTLEKDKQELPVGLAKENNSWTDAITDDQHLYLLDEGRLVKMQKTNLSKYEEYELGLGLCYKLQKVGDTIEIICQHHKRVFVAEIIIRQDGLHLNRFYNQVDKIQDIDFLNGKGFLMGQHQMLILAHSVGRYSLLDLPEPQHMKTYPSFNLHSFTVLVRYSNPEDTLVLGVSNQKAMLVRMQQLPPVLRCNFTGVSSKTRTVIVEIMTSYCDGDWWAWRQVYSHTDSVCRRRIPFVFEVGMALQKNTQNLIVMGSVVLALSLILLLIGAAARWGTKMRVLLKHMAMELQRRQGQSMTGKHIVTSQINMLKVVED